MSYLFQFPIKMPRGSHYGSDYWIVYSYKLNRMVHLYSMLEYANFITLEMNPTVEYFCEQPLKIEAVDSSFGKKFSVFDFWVQYFNSTQEFQEVKYTSELFDNNEAAIRSQKQISFQRDWCNKNNYNYKVVTEKDLYTGQFTLQNLDILHSYLLRFSNSNHMDFSVLEKILLKGPLSIKEIITTNKLPNNHEISALAYYFYLGKISININDRPLDKYSEVKLCETKSLIY